MEKKLLIGEIEHIQWNSVVLRCDEQREVFEIPANVLKQLKTGQRVRLLLRKQRLVRLFNISTQTLYETDFFANKPLLRKYQTLLFIIAAAICSIPAVGVVLSLIFIAALIGVSFRRSEKVAVNVALTSAVSGLIYISLAGYLLMSGYYLAAFLACTLLIFIVLKSAGTIQNKETRVLDQEVSAGRLEGSLS
ncbi:MAG TPA: hypothetical protein VGN40_10360 [Lelliottia sp.]|jgi:hypothetical protein